MGNIEEDVTVEYKKEKREWRKSSDDPEAYCLDNRWGLVRDDGVWKLFVIFSWSTMHEIARCVAGATPPFAWAEGELSKVESRLKSANWDERVIRGKPGDEGFNGGTPIPMQTFDVEKKKRTMRTGK